MNDDVFMPRYVYFTTTLDGYYRVIFVSEDDLTAKTLILDNDTAQQLIKYLESGSIGPKKITDEHITVLLAPNKDNPLYWNVQSDALQQWRRRLGKGSVSHGKTWQEAS
jgi:hypothetical protein